MYWSLVVRDVLSHQCRRHLFENCKGNTGHFRSLLVGVELEKDFHWIQGRQDPSVLDQLDCVWAATTSGAGVAWATSRAGATLSFTRAGTTGRKRLQANSLINSKNNLLYVLEAEHVQSEETWSSKDHSGSRFSLLTGNDACKITVGCRWYTYPRNHLPHGCWNSEDHGRLPDKHMSKHSHKPRIYVVESLVRAANEKATRADACAFTSNPQLSSCRRRFQTGRLPRNLHTCFDCLGRVSRHSQDNCTHLRLLGPCFATAAMEEPIKKRFFGLPLSGSQGLEVKTWTTRVRAKTHETTNT